MFLNSPNSPKAFWRLQTRIRQNVAICGTRQTRPHSPKAIFDKNVTRFDTFARVIRHFREFGASGHCLKFLQYGQRNLTFKSLSKKFLLVLKILNVHVKSNRSGF